MKMIVGIDYTETWGTRKLSYLAAGFHKEEVQLLQFAEASFDEVYLVNIDENDRDFIDAIRKAGDKFA